MEINVNEQAKLVEFWLTNAEKNDEALLASLKPQFKAWKAKKYLPVVYRSGSEDLYELTSALLIWNCRRAAEREVASRRAAEPPRPSVLEKLRSAPAPAEKPAGKKSEEPSL